MCNRSSTMKFSPCMQYFDQVISETLRRWSPIPSLDRACVKDYAFDNGEIQFKIEKGVSILLPSIALHHDPEFYPDPLVFDPERFSDENKRNLHPARLRHRPSNVHSQPIRYNGNKGRVLSLASELQLGAERENTNSSKTKQIRCECRL